MLRQHLSQSSVFCDTLVTTAETYEIQVNQYQRKRVRSVQKRKIMLSEQVFIHFHSPFGVSVTFPSYVRNCFFRNTLVLL
jgi:hypothetical protein